MFSISSQDLYGSEVPGFMEDTGEEFLSNSSLNRYTDVMLRNQRAANIVVSGYDFHNQEAVVMS